MSPLPNASPGAASTILFYNHTDGFSGAEIVLLSILRGLDRARFSPGRHLS